MSVLFTLIIAWSIGLKGFSLAHNCLYFSGVWENTPPHPTINLAVKNLLCCGHQCRSGQWWLLSSASLFYKENAGAGGAWRSPVWEHPVVGVSFHAWPTLQAALLLFRCCVCPRGRGTQPAAAGAGTMPRGGDAIASWERKRLVLGSVCLVMSSSSFGSAISKCYWTVPFPPGIPFKMLWMHFKMPDFWNTLYLFPWALKPQSNCSLSSVVSEPAQNLLFGL